MISLDVPASSANLGAGFDALALALDLSDVITITEAADLAAGEIAVTVGGEGAAELPADGSDRFSTAFRDAVGPTDHGWRVHMENAIPLGRGLGSSAAATVAGLVAARELSDGGGSSPPTDAQVLAVATTIEGHPENAAAALLGGFVVAAMASDGPLWVRIEPPPKLRVALFVPDRMLPTPGMRAVLPRDVPREDAVHNVGRAALAVAAFSEGRLDLLAEATDDRLHEPYRAAAYPELPGLLAAARDAGALGACLSGAGSTVLAFADSESLAQSVAEAFAAAAALLRLAGGPLVVAPRAEGVRVVSRSP